MTDDATQPAGLSQTSWREKLIPLILWVAVVFLLFRPLLWGSLRPLLAGQPGGSPGARVGPAISWGNLAADFLTFALCLMVVWILLVTRIGSIAKNTFREAVRNRILYFILFFALILMGTSGIVKELAIGEHERIVRNLGLTCISFFGLMAAIFVGISLVYNELERKTIYTIVSKPVHRYQFLLGKYFGLLLTVYVIVAIMTCFFFMVVNYQALTADEIINEVLYTQDDAGVYHQVSHMGWVKGQFLLKAAGLAFARGLGNIAGFAHGAVSQNLMVVVAMIALELMIVTAFAMLYSSFSTPTLSAVLTVMTFLAGRLNEDIMRQAERVLKKSLGDQAVATFGELSLWAQLRVGLVHVAALIVPNLDSLNVTSQATYKETVSVWRYSVLYAFCYTVSVLLLSILIFRRRNFK